MPVIITDIPDLLFCKTEIEIFIKDFGLTFQDVVLAYQTFQDCFSDDSQGALDYSSLFIKIDEYWEFHFRRYPIDFKPFLKFAAYSNQSRVKLSSCAQSYC